MSEAVKPKGSEIRVGISGWRFAPWRGVFYPKGLRQTDELQYASRQLNFNEINGTFYSLQTPSSFESWYKATPDDFVFAIKGPQEITHRKRLKGIEKALANFLASGLLGLEEKLGPILWQFPPNFKYDHAKMEAFFKLLPRDTKSAASMARKHDEYLNGRAITKVKTNRPLRHAVEIRHYSFKVPEYVELLRNHGIAMVNSDTTGRWPVMEDVTSDFCYLRLQADEKLYKNGYTPAALKTWAKKIVVWQKGGEPEDAKRVTPPLDKPAKPRDIFISFVDDEKVRSPIDALALSELLGIRQDKPTATNPNQSGD
jgi:uncharacterized protein YecE (DUF72 family)